MKNPARSAASMMSSPGDAVTLRPLIVRFTCSGGDRLSVASPMADLVGRHRAAPLLHVEEELVSKAVDARDYRGGNGRPEDADGRLLRGPGETRGDVVAGVEEQVEVLLPPEAVLDPPDHLVHPPGPLPARRALAAGLPVEKAGDAPCRPHRTGRLVHDDDRAGAEHGARLADGVLVEAHVEVLGEEPGRRDPTWDEGLQLPAEADPTAEALVVDEVPEGGRRHLELVPAGPLHVAGEGEQAGARRGALPEGGERRPSVEDDPGQVGHRLDVVHDGRLPVQPDGGREVRRLDAREPPLALERFEQRRLLAADVGAGPRVHHEVERELRPEDRPPERSVLVGLVHGLGEPLEAEGELAPAEDEGLGRPDRVGGDDGPLDDLVGVSLDEEMVLERGGLRLVAVHDEVGRRRLPQHRPLPPRREAGTAPAEQAGGVHLLVDRLRGHRERFAETLVTARGKVPLEGVRVGVLEAGRDDAGGVGEHHSPSPAPAAAGGSGATSFSPGGGVPAACGSFEIVAATGVAAGSPTARLTLLSTPWRGTVSSRRPAARSSTSRSKASSSSGPKKRWFTCTQTAWSQPARHSASSRVNNPSGVVCPTWMPRRCFACPRTS